MQKSSNFHVSTFFAFFPQMEFGEAATGKVKSIVELHMVIWINYISQKINQKFHELLKNSKRKTSSRALRKTSKKTRVRKMLAA